MDYLFILIYQLLIQLYGFGIRLAALFVPKANLWVAGRKGIFKRLEKAFKEETAPIIWMHCASLGEFEQGRPLTENIKNTFPNYKIVLTFFSPSGYEIRKNYAIADYVFYLPLDSPKNANQFLDIIQPKLVFFIKYEFWYFYLAALQKRNIKHYLVAGVFKKEQFFFKKYAKWYLKVIQGFDHLFLQDQASQKIIESAGFSNYNVVGDPRIDSVLAIADAPQPISIIHQFKNNKKLFILGSSHTKDAHVFMEFLKLISTKQYYEHWHFLIAPHEIELSKIQQIEALSLIPTYRFSTKKAQINPIAPSLFILDTIGQLSAAYQYADAVYIGGGFDKSIHNILEPAVFGMPISFGPQYHRFTEAVELVKKGGAISINSSLELVAWFDQLQTTEKREQIGKTCRDYTKQNKGATQKIINYLIKKNILKSI